MTETCFGLPLAGLTVDRFAERRMVRSTDAAGTGFEGVSSEAREKLEAPTRVRWVWGVGTLSGLYVSSVEGLPGHGGLIRPSERQRSVGTGGWA
jgi:hypothetical protein